jgi:hypothetical protein
MGAHLPAANLARRTIPNNAMSGNQLLAFLERYGMPTAAMVGI